MSSFKEQFARLKAHRPFAQEGRESVLLADYRKLWDEFGEDRFTRAVDAFIQESNVRFFPTIPEFRGYAPSADEPAYVNCGSCKNGWVYAEGFDNGGNPYVIRCQCKRMEAI